MKKLLKACLVLVSMWLAAPALSQENPTNIILILADDVGAETIGVYGGESYATPNLDRLANDGIRFDHAHSQPLCTPSRVKIMTGQYNFRNYKHFGYLDPKEETFAHTLKDAGYRTAVAGKWQLYGNRLVSAKGALPDDAGFEEYKLWQLKPDRKDSRFWGPLITTNGVEKKFGKELYGPDLFNEYVLNYIDENKDSPFFIYYPMVLAHDPWVTTPDMRDETASDQDKFSAMMAYMDKMVGNVRTKIEETGLAENTLIIFVGDNGTGKDIVSRYQGLNVQGAKGKTINAGSRVPFIAWGAGVTAGEVSDSLVNLNDVFPTLAEAAGVNMPKGHPGDGQSLSSELKGEGSINRDDIFIHYDPQWVTAAATRYAFDRQYKLYQDGGFYDMVADPLENNVLEVNLLQGEVLESYKRLHERILSMPGTLPSPRVWIPLKIKVIGGFLFFLLLSLVWMIRRLIKRVVVFIAGLPRKILFVTLRIYQLCWRRVIR